MTQTHSPQNTLVAFIGTGAMGGPMAANLLAAGYTVKVWNRNAARCAPLVMLGAQACISIPEAVHEAAFVVSMVSDDVASTEVMLGRSPVLRSAGADGTPLSGVVASAGIGTIIIDCSTNTPATAREIAHAARKRGLQYLDAPVSGSLTQARGRELVFMVGGDNDAFGKARPLFDAMGRMSRHMGTSGAGASIKLVNNMLSGTMNAAIAEALSVAEAAGLDPALTQEILNEGAAGSRLTRTKMSKIFARDFTPQFQLALMEKDMRYFMALAQELDRPVAIASLVRSQLQSARRAGLGEQDVSAVFLATAGENLPGPKGSGTP